MTFTVAATMPAPVESVTVPSSTARSTCANAAVPRNRARITPRVNFRSRRREKTNKIRIMRDSSIKNWRSDYIGTDVGGRLNHRRTATQLGKPWNERDSRKALLQGDKRHVNTFSDWEFNSKVMWRAWQPLGIAIAHPGRGLSSKRRTTPWKLFWAVAPSHLITPESVLQYSSVW